MTILRAWHTAQFNQQDIADRSSMTKILSFVFIVIMALHLFKPLGLPGLKKRKDFWKIAVGAVLAILVVGVSRHVG
ncbi:hypothetical protein V9K92_14110 [Phyllobacterium sp. CCNWLW109]